MDVRLRSFSIRQGGRQLSYRPFAFGQTDQDLETFLLHQGHIPPRRQVVRLQIVRLDIAGRIGAGQHGFVRAQPESEN